MHRLILLVLIPLTLCGCDRFASFAGRYSLFETSKGAVYRLDTTSGKTEVVYSPTGWPKLNAKTLYEGEDGKTYEYLGAGKLKELSTTEAADRIVEKYAK
jgi:hypothetical protein